MRHRSQLGRAIWLLIALVGCGSDETPSNDGGTGGAAGSAGSGGVAGAGGSAGSAGSAGQGASAGAGGSAGSAGEAGAAGAGAWPAGCDDCHGSDANPAPPLDLDGNTDTSSPGVGAHRAHLDTNAWHKQIGCAECHVVPTKATWDPALPGHMNGINDIEWGSLAGPSGSYDTTDNTCSNTYCHGATLAADSSNRAPSWVVVDGSQASCGTSCHTLPPGGDHSPSTNCASCHASVVASITPGTPPSVQWGDPSLHIDGTVQVDGMTCTACHGDPVGGDPAPPVGTNGETSTSDPAVGAHQQHLRLSSWHRRGTCADCHATPGTLIHSNGTVDFAWGDPSGRDGVTPSYSSANNTCSNYCHGASLDADIAGKTSNRTPTWTKVDGTQDSCGTSCHTIPPGGGHPNVNECSLCHPNIGSIDVANPSSASWVDKDLHIDGRVTLD